MPSLWLHTNLLYHNPKLKSIKTSLSQASNFKKDSLAILTKNIFWILIFYHNNLMTTAEEDLQAVEVTLRKTAEELG